MLRLTDALSGIAELRKRIIGICEMRDCALNPDPPGGQLRAKVFMSVLGVTGATCFGVRECDDAPWCVAFTPDADDVLKRCDHGDLNQEASTSPEVLHRV